MTPGFLGIDLGTGSVKAVIVAGDGRVLGQGGAEYPLRHPRPGYAEQDPDDWWDATIRAVRRARADAGEVAVASIALSGQMHGTVLLDAHDDAIGPAIIWADTRSSRQVDEITARIGARRLVDVTGSPLAVGFQAATVRWVQQEDRDRWSRTRRILLPKDYLGWRLTGVHATDPSDASSTLLFDVRTRDWAHEVLAALDIARDLLPEVRESTDIRGRLTDSAANLLGLSPAIPVMVGGGDAPLAALAAGVVDPGAMLLTISTGSQVILPTTEPRIDPKGRIHSWCSCIPRHADGSGAHWYQMGATMVSGLAMRWLRDRVFALAGDDSYDRMTTWAAEIPPGAGGLVFLPYLAGERTPHMDPAARGLFLGLTAHHDRRHLTRATMEGATLALFDAYDVIASSGASSPDHAILTGGGARSTLWQQIVADVFGIPIVPLANVVGSAMGAALLAAAGVDAVDLAATARAWAGYGDPVRPSPDARSVYRQILPLFREAYVKHTADFAALSRLSDVVEVRPAGQP